MTICPDYHIGYVEDNYAFGTNSHNWKYRHFHWNHIDHHIWFAHARLTIPPTAQTNICHAFGVRSLATFIVEREEDIHENRKLLSGEVVNGEIVRNSCNL